MLHLQADESDSADSECAALMEAQLASPPRKNSPIRRNPSPQQTPAQIPTTSPVKLLETQQRSPVRSSARLKSPQKMSSPIKSQNNSPEKVQSNHSGPKSPGVGAQTTLNIRRSPRIAGQKVPGTDTPADPGGVLVQNTETLGTTEDKQSENPEENAALKKENLSAEDAEKLGLGSCLENDLELSASESESESGWSPVRPKSSPICSLPEVQKSPGKSLCSPRRSRRLSERSNCSESAEIALPTVSPRVRNLSDSSMDSTSSSCGDFTGRVTRSKARMESPNRPQSQLPVSPVANASRSPRFAAENAKKNETDNATVSPSGSSRTTRSLSGNREEGNALQEELTESSTPPSGVVTRSRSSSGQSQSDKNEMEEESRVSGPISCTKLRNEDFKQPLPISPRKTRKLTKSGSVDENSPEAKLDTSDRRVTRSTSCPENAVVNSDNGITTRLRSSRSRSPRSGSETDEDPAKRPVRVPQRERCNKAEVPGTAEETDSPENAGTTRVAVPENVADKANASERLGFPHTVETENTSQTDTITHKGNEPKERMGDNDTEQEANSKDETGFGATQQQRETTVSADRISNRESVNCSTELPSGDVTESPTRVTRSQSKLSPNPKVIQRQEEPKQLEQEKTNKDNLSSHETDSEDEEPIQKKLNRSRSRIDSDSESEAEPETVAPVTRAKAAAMGNKDETKIIENTDAGE